MIHVISMKIHSKSFNHLIMVKIGNIHNVYHI